MMKWMHRKEMEPSIQGAVCVIDRDHGIQNSISVLLGTLGVAVVTFTTAEEFLSRADYERPALIITELSLPGMSGFELKNKLDQKGIKIPTVGLTGEANPRDEREASHAGFLELIEKPFVSRAVVEQVKTTLGIPR